MPPEISESLLGQLFKSVDAIRAAVLPAPDPEPGPDPVADPDVELWVDPDAGDDGNDGRSPGSAFRTFTRAAQTLKPRSRLVLRDGLYTDPLRLNALGTTAERPVWIKAENPGGAVITGTVRPMGWQPDGDGIYKTAFPARPWAGHGGGRFLFSYLSPADLRAASLVGRKKPAYGLAWKGGALFVRLPEGADPNEEPVLVTSAYARPVVEIRNSPHVILDGITVTGAGNTAAIDAGETSHHLWLQNVVSDLSRMLVRLPPDSTVKWCQYGYGGLLPWAEEVIELNGGTAEAVFDLVKRYNTVDGNAHYEGRIAVSNEQPSRRCRFEHNLIGPCFDGMSFGQFSESESFRDVFVCCFDDAMEMESWRTTHDSANLTVTEPLILNPFGAAISHQDTARQIRGPHIIRRAEIRCPHPMARPAYLIKNMGPFPHFPVISYDRGYFENLSGPSGWGKNVNFVYLDHAKGKGSRLSLRNSVVVVDRLDDWAADWTPDLDYNVLVSPVDYPHIRGLHGRWFRSIDELMLRGAGEDGFDIRPLPGSPLIGAGAGGVTVGPYDLGDELRHRPLETAFTDELPAPWAALS